MIPKLPELRSKTGITRQCLAKLLGVTPATIWNWTTGRIKPPKTVRHFLADIATIEKIATTLRAEGVWETTLDRAMELRRAVKLPVLALLTAVIGEARVREIFEKGCAE